MAAERRSRITLLLPAPENPAEFIVLDEVLTELTRSCGGATASQITPTVFNGWWIDDGRVHPDANILVISDSPLPHSDAALPLCANDGETPTPSQITVEGGERCLSHGERKEAECPAAAGPSWP